MVTRTGTAQEGGEEGGEEREVLGAQGGEARAVVDLEKRGGTKKVVKHRLPGIKSWWWVAAGGPYSSGSNTVRVPQGSRASPPVVSRQQWVASIQ